MWDEWGAGVTQVLLSATGQDGDKHRSPANLNLNPRWLLWTWERGHCAGRGQCAQRFETQSPCRWGCIRLKRAGSEGVGDGAGQVISQSGAGWAVVPWGEGVQSEGHTCLATDVSGP